MIKHTQAAVRLRGESQRFLDFVVLIANAVPQLRASLSAPGVVLTALTLEPPDYFGPKGCEPSRLIKLLPVYQDELARVSVITLFSYFEAYVKAVLAEIIAFHGGNDAFVARAEKRARTFLRVLPAALQEDKRKIQEPAKPGKKQKYEKHTRALMSAGFRFPTELLSSYGVRMLIKKAHPKTGMKAWEIQDVLGDGLHFDVTPAMRKRLDDIRELRNRIAHGGGPKVPFKSAMAVARDLHTFAALIDAHIVEHFFVVENFT
jgi:hypothetical protein